MKILNLIQCANLGGMEQASLRLMRGLKARGHSVSLLSLNPVGDLGPLLTESGIPHDGLPYLGRGGWRSHGVLKKKLRQYDADALLMTGHNLLASMALGDFCKDRRVLALHYHHTGVCRPWQWKMIYHVARRNFNVITYPCDFIRDEAAVIAPATADMSFTVRNPMDAQPVPASGEKARAREALGIEPGVPVVGNGGWLIPRKRFDVFLRVAAEVRKKHPQTVFAIAGDGPERERLGRLANELGLNGSVRWLGWRKDMATFYKALDAVLFNSDWDAMGLTPLEAMSFGVPAVCSVLNGGLQEVVNSEQVGLFLPSHDVSKLADGVSRLLSDSERARAIGLAGRERVAEVSGTDAIVEWHEGALEGRARPGGSPCRAEMSKPQDNDVSSCAVLFGRLGPYHFARLRAAGRHFPTTAIELCRSDSTYAWDIVEGADGFKRVTLYDSAGESGITGLQVANRVRTTLDEQRPSFVALPGWTSVDALAALQWCLQTNTPTVLMSESNAWDEHRIVWKEWIKSRLVRMCSAGLVGGKAQSDYLGALGMAKDRIAFGYDAVDNDHFLQRAASARKNAAGTRAKLGLPERYFLASMRFVEKKNVPRLIRAYHLYHTLMKAGSAEAKTWDLVILGDGPMKSDVCDLISEFQLSKHVHLAGFKQYDELPAYYGLASAFIHPSTVEQWGLVVNEAMASGLPVLVSKRCGCAADLVHEGQNGFTFDPFDAETPAKLMAKLSLMPAADLARMGEASQAVIASWGPERFAEGMRSALRAAKSVRPHQASALDKLLLKFLLMRRAN